MCSLEACRRAATARCTRACGREGARGSSNSVDGHGAEDELEPDLSPHQCKYPRSLRVVQSTPNRACVVLVAPLAREATRRVVAAYVLRGHVQRTLAKAPLPLCSFCAIGGAVRGGAAQLVALLLAEGVGIEPLGISDWDFCKDTAIRLGRGAVRSAAWLTLSRESSRVFPPPPVRLGERIRMRHSRGARASHRPAR